MIRPLQFAKRRNGQGERRLCGVRCGVQRAHEHADRTGSGGGGAA